MGLISAIIKAILWYEEFMCESRRKVLSAEVNNYSIRDLHNSQIIRHIIRKTGRKKKPNSITKLFNDSFEIFLRSFYAILLVDFLQNISLFLGIVLEYDRTFPPPSDKRNACKNTQKGSYFLLRHGGMRGRELRNECGARVKKKYSRDCDKIIDLAICCCTYASFIADWQLLNSSNCMLFPVSKQTACLRLSGHCRLVRDIVLQLSVWYGNNGQVITPENSKKRGVNFSKQARKKTQKGKKLKPRNIVDRANYLKLSFHVMY